MSTVVDVIGPKLIECESCGQPTAKQLVTFEDGEQFQVCAPCALDAIRRTR